MRTNSPPSSPPSARATPPPARKNPGAREGERTKEEGGRRKGGSTLCSSTAYYGISYEYSVQCTVYSVQCTGLGRRTPSTTYSKCDGAYTAHTKHSHIHTHNTIVYRDGGTSLSVPFPHLASPLCVDTCQPHSCPELFHQVTEVNTGEGHHSALEQVHSYTHTHTHVRL